MPSITQGILDALARTALQFPLAERALVAGTRSRRVRTRLRLGAIANRYPHVLGRRELRIAEMDGYRLWVNVGEPLGVVPYFFREPCVVWLTRSLIGPGDTCVDAGANSGLYTFLLASVVGPTGQVYAFEPNPEFAALIDRSIHLNGFDGFVRVVPSALDSTSGEIKRLFLSVNTMNSGTSSLLNHGTYVSAECAVDVKTIAFDDFARQVQVERFRLVKVDVERAEEFVIAGASRTLADRRIDFLIVELHARSRAQELLEQANYMAYFLDHDREKVTPAAESRRQAGLGDFLFVRPGLDVPR